MKVYQLIRRPCLWDGCLNFNVTFKFRYNLTFKFVIALFNKLSPNLNLWPEKQRKLYDPVVWRTTSISLKIFVLYDLTIILRLFPCKFISSTSALFFLVWLALRFLQVPHRFSVVLNFGLWLDHWKMLILYLMGYILPVAWASAGVALVVTDGLTFDQKLISCIHNWPYTGRCCCSCRRLSVNQLFQHYTWWLVWGVFVMWWCALRPIFSTFCI